jgi:hypothetical protein
MQNAAERMRVLEKLDRETMLRGVCGKVGIEYDVKDGIICGRIRKVLNVHN